MRGFLLHGLLLATSAILHGQSQEIQAALAAGSYFPLEVGNRWVYRIDSRTESAGYQTWRVDRTEERDGKTYFVIAISGKGSLVAEAFFRTDDRGRIYVLTGAGEQLFLDPVDSGAAQLRIQARGAPFGNALGSFPDSLTYLNSVNTLTLETGILVRGIGLVSSSAQLITGSSGGFSEGRTLVEAVIGGKLQFSLAAAGLQLGLESLSLDVTGKRADNCAVPCYFVACYLFGFTDPPGTYKPCARARIALTNWPAGASRDVQLQLLAPDGSAVSDQTVKVESDAPAYTQLRLYSAPDQPFAPGLYRLIATVAGGMALSSIALEIR